MNRTTFGVLAAATALILPVAAQAQQLPAAVVAVVDRDEIARTCTQCAAAGQQLQAQVNAYQQRETQLATQVQTEQRAIEAALNAVPQGQQPPAALQTRIQAFQTLRSNAANELGPRQDQLRRNQAFLVQQILQRMDPLITQVMQQRGANIAVDVGSTVAHQQALNITAAVLALMNANTAAFNVNAPAQQQPAQQPAATPQQQQQRPRPQGR